MKSQLNIRPAKTGDAAAISELILRVAQQFNTDSHSTLPAWFLNSVTPTAIQDYVTAPDFQYRVCYSDSTLAGVIALRAESQIYHLFVDALFQRRGIATMLWQHVKDQVLTRHTPEMFWVRSSLYAVPIYERFGFSRIGEILEKDGLHFVKMELKL